MKRTIFFIGLLIAFSLLAVNTQAAITNDIIEGFKFDEGSGSVAQGFKGVMNLSVGDSSMWQTGSYCVDSSCIMTTDDLNAELQIVAIPEKVNPGNYDSYTVCTVLTYHKYDAENDNVWGFGSNRYQLDGYYENPNFRGRFDKADGTSCNAYVSDSGFVVNQTYKICAGHNRTTNFIYVDGSLLDSTDCGDTLRYNVSGETFRVGEGPFNGADVYGTYDSFLILNNSPDNVAEWYNSTGSDDDNWVESTTDTCTYSGSGDWIITDDCVLTTDTSLPTNDIIMNCPNYVILKANLDPNRVFVANNCKFAIADGGIA